MMDISEVIKQIPFWKKLVDEEKTQERDKKRRKSVQKRNERKEKRMVKKL